MMQMDSQEHGSKQTYGSNEGYQGYQQQDYGNVERDTDSPQGSMYDDTFVDSLAQRLSQRMAEGPAGKLPSSIKSKATAGQRLALAIVSVILVAFYTAIILTTSHLSSTANLIGIGIMGLVIFLINGVFNDKA